MEEEEEEVADVAMEEEEEEEEEVEEEPVAGTLARAVRRYVRVACGRRASWPSCWLPEAGTIA